MPLLLALCLIVAGALLGGIITWQLGRARPSLAIEPVYRPAAQQDVLKQPVPAGSRSAIAVLGVPRTTDFRARLGQDGARRLIDSIVGRVVADLPGGHISRIRPATVEIDFHAVPDRLDNLMEQLASSIRADMSLEDLSSVGLGIGYAVVDEALTERAPTIERAEHALGRAHISHQATARFDEEDERHADRRDGILRDLRIALDRNEMYLCYQPKLRSRVNKVDAAEALLRWRHPDHGLIPPDEFIPLAEASGEIDKITRWVLTQAIADQALLADQGHHLTVHVNLSGRLVADRTFADWALERCADAVGRIGFEVTETAVIDDPEAALTNLNAFAAAGIKIAIDDYGTGLSSLAYLKAMPADELKIDKLFISALATTNRDPLLVRSTIDLAHALEMEVTAEGVDTATALALLRVMGCDLVQGYHIAEPVRLPMLREFLDAHVAEDDHQAAPGPFFQPRREVSAAA